MRDHAARTIRKAGKITDQNRNFWRRIIARCVSKCALVNLEKADVQKPANQIVPTVDPDASMGQRTVGLVKKFGAVGIVQIHKQRRFQPDCGQTKRIVRPR